MFAALAIPSFIAGVLTFLAPCTLPLVPGYLAFISGVSILDSQKTGKISPDVHKKIIKNGLLYVLGFSVVFILLGTVLSGVAGAGFLRFRRTLEIIAGGLIILIGLYMTHLFDVSIFRFLSAERRIRLPKNFTPGKPLSSFLFGATFALGWTPCVGPVLGSVLLLASSSSGAALQGAALLAIFSLGLALPFLLVAFGIGQAARVIQRITKFMPAISVVGGAFIALIGIVLLTGTMGEWTAIFFRAFDFMSYDRLLDYF